MKVACIYDTNTPMTTGVYFHRSFDELGFDVTAYHHDNVKSIPDEYDLYFIVDSGPQYEIPKWKSGPSVYYSIDVHLDFENRYKMAQGATVSIMAQNDCGAERATNRGLKTIWVPLGCDPEIHKDYHVERDLDIAFVGHLYEDDTWRTTIKNKLLEHGLKEDKIFIGEATKEEMGHIYSRAKIVLNHTVRDNKQDINMRVFEGMSCGAVMLTQKLDNNDMNKIFAQGTYEEYKDDTEMFEKIDAILTNYNEKYALMASRGKMFVRASHTYTQHLRVLLGALMQSVAENDTKKN